MGVGKDYINRTILVYNGSGGYEDGLLDSVMFEAEYTINYQGEVCLPRNYLSKPKILQFSKVPLRREDTKAIWLDVKYTSIEDRFFWDKTSLLYTSIE